VPAFPRPDPAQGVFETLLVVDGRPVEVDAHLARLRASVGELFGAEPPAGATETVRARAAGLDLARLRVTLAPGHEGALAADVHTAALEPQTIFPSWEDATQLRTFLVAGGVGAHKWADRTGLLQLEAGVPRGCVPLILDAGGVVLEASRSNVFAVEGGVLLTPRCDGRILPGVARARVIAAAAALGIEVREVELTLEVLKASGEAFLTNALRGVEPVASVDAVRLGPAGQAVREIAASIRRDWIGEGVALGR
jgi:para-aminobenzoate synthetase / 4-amino-4-deoxychorismate lyase